jgi:hypothetical protein
MRLIIEARLANGDNDTVGEGDRVLAVVERPDCSLADLGLSLAEGRSLLAKVKAKFISKQVQWWISGSQDLRPDPLSELWCSLEPQGQSLDGAAHRAVKNWSAAPVGRP